VNHPDDLRVEPEYLPVPAPRLNWLALEPPERAVARTIEFNLFMLEYHAKAFGHAVALFEHCARKRRPHSRDLFTEWQFLAARDGAMNAYHCSAGMQRVREIFHRCPTWQAQIDHSILRGAHKDLKAVFPSVDDMRHAVAHSAELTETPERHAENATKHAATLAGGGQIGPNTMVLAHLDGDGVFSFTNKGQALSYSITGAALKGLNAAVGRFFSGFRCLEIPQFGQPPR
jgi:hypothetical protein